jgi:transcription antitermination factor NusG
MGFTYALQVPTGKEIRIKYMIEDQMKRLGNPGIIAIHAFETFTQMFRGKDTAPKQLKSKVPGYIFVTVKNTENYNSAMGGNKECGLGMNPACWHFLKRIPNVYRILNRYIHHDEYKQFFEITDLETSIQISEQENKRSLKDMINKALDILKKKNKNKELAILNKVNMITRGTKNKKTVYIIPYSLFKVTRDRIDPQERGEVRTLTDARYILPQIAKTIKKWCYGF